MFAQLTFHPIQVDFKDSEQLAEFIVNFSGHICALFFTGGLKTGGKGAELTAGALQSFFGPAALGNVADAADDAHGFARWIANDVAAIQHGSVSAILATKPVVASPRRLAALFDAVYGFDHSVPVVGLQTFQPPIDLRGPIFRAITE